MEDVQNKSCVSKKLLGERPSLFQLVNVFFKVSVVFQDGCTRDHLEVKLAIWVPEWVTGAHVFIHPDVVANYIGEGDTGTSPDIEEE